MCVFFIFTLFPSAHNAWCKYLFECPFYITYLTKNIYAGIIVMKDK